MTGTNRPYRSDIVRCDTGKFAGMMFATNALGTKRFVFKPSDGKRNNPVFAITDAEFNVIRWVCPEPFPGNPAACSSSTGKGRCPKHAA